MKRIFIVVIISSIAASSCKKKTTVYTLMTVNVAGDSTWTTTNVSTENDNTVVYINAKNSVLDKAVYLTLTGYQPGNHVYVIQNTGATPNVNKSQANYQSGGNVTFAVGGTISVTHTNTKTIEGTFDFAGGNAHVTGTFIAPIP